MNKVISKEAKREYIKGTKEWLEKYFPIVRASELSLEDDFLKHEPETDKQREFKNQLIKAIKAGLRDFRAQVMDPSLDEQGEIYYQEDKVPALKILKECWDKKAKDFMPEKNSRIGTTNERIAFLGLFIKYLIEEEDYTVSKAWEEVCDHSEMLGWYNNSFKGKYVMGLYCYTGSMQVGKWYDLANTCKITIDNDEFLLVGGCYTDNGKDHPLADVNSVHRPGYVDISSQISVLWIVMDV